MPYTRVTGVCIVASNFPVYVGLQVSRHTHPAAIPSPAGAFKRAQGGSGINLFFINIVQTKKLVPIIMHRVSDTYIQVVLSTRVKCATEAVLQVTGNIRQ